MLFPVMNCRIHQNDLYWCIGPGGNRAVGRTNIELDDALVEKAMTLTGANTKREVVDIALRRLVEKGSLYRALRGLKGKLAWEGGIDTSRSARTTHG